MIRLRLNGAGKVTHEEHLLAGKLGRLRLVRQGSDGLIYLLTDALGNPIVGNLNRFPDAAPHEKGFIELELTAEKGEPAHRARAKIFLLRGGFRLLVGRDLEDLQAARSLLLGRAFAHDLVERRPSVPGPAEDPPEALFGLPRRRHTAENDRHLREPLQRRLVLLEVAEEDVAHGENAEHDCRLEPEGIRPPHGGRNCTRGQRGVKRG